MKKFLLLLLSAVFMLGMAQAQDQPQKTQKQSQIRVGATTNVSDKPGLEGALKAAAFRDGDELYAIDADAPLSLRRHAAKMVAEQCKKGLVSYEEYAAYCMELGVKVKPLKKIKK